ncbi:Uma2 family endonuclease [Candidatus Halobeggiatoa sp. HSG11]|nr:Uma2 family endonuclease [Candidatus Halobeggiatoa sp. HSG11]
MLLSKDTSEQFEYISSSLNRSYICTQLMRQLLQDDNIQAFTGLALDIENCLIPDISVFQTGKVRHNLFEDILKVKEMPILAIEVIPSNHSIKHLFKKSKLLINAGIKTVWLIEPYGRSIFVLSKKDKNLFHEEIVTSEGIQVDFSKIFNN